MSVRLVERAFRRQDVKGVPKLLLLALAYHADDNGVCWPGGSRLMTWASLRHRRSVYVAIDTLVSAGLVTRLTSGRGRTTTRYQVRLSSDPTVSSDSPVTTHTQDTAVVTPQSPVVVIPESLGVVTGESHKRSVEPSVEPSVNRHHPDADASASVSTPSTKTKTGTKRKTSTATDEGFARFWSAYPKRRSKADAEKAWSSLAPTDDLQGAILAALTWQCRQRDWRKDGGQYVPLPATYLRQRRWEDDPPDALELRAQALAERYGALHAEVRRVPVALDSPQNEAAARRLVALEPDDLRLDAVCDLCVRATSDYWTTESRDLVFLERHYSAFAERLARHGMLASDPPAKVPTRTCGVTCSGGRPGCSGFADIAVPVGEAPPTSTVCAHCADPRHDEPATWTCKVCGDAHTGSRYHADVLSLTCPKLPADFNFGGRLALAASSPSRRGALLATLKAYGIAQCPALDDLLHKLEARHAS